MGNKYEQAPILKANGEKYNSFKKWGKAIRTHELEAAICCCLGNRDMVALKTMLFFTGNAEDIFRVAKKTICGRMNISEQKYYEARSKLQNMGWIYYDERENTISINYNRIYSDYKAYLKEKEGFRDDSPENFSVGVEDNSKIINDNTLNENKNFRNDSPQTSLEVSHNKITNNINNSKKNKISGACAAVAAPPREFIDKEIINNERDKLENWRKSELQKISELFGNPIKNDDLRKMYSSEEFKKFKVEVQKRYDAFCEKYGVKY